MKFYSKLQCNETVIIDGEPINFINREFDSISIRQEAVLKAQGYAHNEEIKVNAVSYDDMTKAEITAKLTALGIEFDARKNKESLIDLLKAGE